MQIWVGKVCKADLSDTIQTSIIKIPCKEYVTLECLKKNNDKWNLKQFLIAT